MSTATFPDRTPSAAVLPHASFAPVARVAAFDLAPTAGIETTSATESVANAHRAVEAVLVAADRFSSGDRHSVELQFSVGGTDLNVRVEMRADEVRATFRTDSPELRNALAHEWQAADTSSASADRPFRLAAPVITSTNGDASHSSGFAGGDTPSRQRDSGSRRAESEVFASIAAAARAPRAAATADVASLATAPLNASRRDAHRLLAHA